MSARRLVADTGGTNVRFAIADENGGLERLQSYRVDDFPTFADALAAYRSGADGLKDIDAAAIAAAGPVDGDRVKLTNNTWAIDRGEASSLLAGVPVALVNDLEAVAAALPYLSAADLSFVGGPVPMRPEWRTMLAINVGTGFGAASATYHNGRWWTIPSEAGHMTLGAIGEDEREFVPQDASVESVLSGKGLVHLHERIAGTSIRSGGSACEAAAVIDQATHAAAAAHAVDLFSAILGRVAGDLALATCAWGGVYLCGSVAVGWSAIAAGERFRTEFTRKGPMRVRMQQVPTAAIRRENAALFGLAMMPLPA